MSLYLFSQSHRKTEKQNSAMDASKCLCLAAFLIKVYNTYGKLTEADQFAIAVVGTRNSTTYGRQVTERIVTDLAKGQVTIVSGLALGIDTIAHTAALDAGGRTIAVLASGLDIIYPPTNRGLARRIVESGQGALITEYPLGVKPGGGDSVKLSLP